jgi:hypothetical protein
LSLDPIDETNLNLLLSLSLVKMADKDAHNSGIFIHELIQEKIKKILTQVVNLNKFVPAETV